MLITLKAKFARAETLLQDVSAKLKELTKKLPGLILQWDESYVSLLLMSKKLRNELSCAQDEDQGKVKDVEKKIKRNEKAIVAMEKKHHIRERWSDLSRVFVTVKSRLYEKRKSELLLSLHCMASERCFLVELFLGDGQAIAIKLAKQIDKVVKSIHKTLSEINGYLPNDVPQILYDDAKDPKSSIYSEVQEEGDTVPALVRRQIIDLFCLHNRCQEELELLN